MSIEIKYLIGIAWVTREPEHYANVDLIRKIEHLGGEFFTSNENEPGVRSSYGALIPSIEEGSEELFKTITGFGRAMFYGGGKSFGLTACSLNPLKIASFVKGDELALRGYLFDRINIFQAVRKSKFANLIQESE